MPEKDFARVRKAVAVLLSHPGSCPAGLRRDVEAYAARSSGAERPTPEAPPDDWIHYVDDVTRHADRITDADIARLRAAGHGEDEIFEVTLCAAAGASLARLERGLRALEEASRAPVHP
jgi:hypothetical protein